MRRVFVRVWAFGILAAGLAGCTRGPEFAEVEGTVTQGGKPLEKVQVEFYPDGIGPRSMAITDAAGKFVLKSDGAVVGGHKVVLRDVSIYPDRPLTREELNQDFGKGKKIRIPATYGDTARTPLTKTVTGGQKNTIDIEVK
jgi:hypothetical protein